MNRVKDTSWYTTCALLFMLFVSPFALAEKKDAPMSIEGTTKVSADELVNLVETLDDLVIIDSRKASDREEGVIPGSIPITDTDMNAENLAAEVATKDSPVAFYCNGPKCGRSGNAATMAIGLGYSNVYWFRGGWKHWKESGLPIEK